MSEMRRETLEVGGNPYIELVVPAGKAAFRPGEAGMVEVWVEGRRAEEFVVEQSEEKVFLRAPGGSWRRQSFDVTVRAPLGTRLEVRTASADVEARVGLGSLRVDTASGDVDVEFVEGEATVHTASGDVLLGSVDGGLRAKTASGDVRVREARGPATLNSASGDVQVKAAFGALRLGSASGDVEVGCYAGEDLECRVVSGDVRVAPEAGGVLDVDLVTLSGDIRNEFVVGEGDGGEAGETGSSRLFVKTVSGDIALVRANT